MRGPRAERLADWAERVNDSGASPLCACGCGGRVVVRVKHRLIGLPRYLHGHHPNPLRRGYDKLRAKGYKMVGEVAAALGVSQTTLRRMEEARVVPKAKRLQVARGRDVRVYTEAQVRAMVRLGAKERWRSAGRDGGSSSRHSVCEHDAAENAAS